MRKILIYFSLFVILLIIVPVVISLGADLIIIWDSLASSPIKQNILKWLVILVSIFVVVWGIAIPYFKIRLFPSITKIIEMMERRNAFELKKNVSILYQNCYHLKEEDKRKEYRNDIIKKMQELDEEKENDRNEIVKYFEELVKERFNEIDAIILKQTKYTFFLTTISQNGKFDFITSFCGNMRMIYNIVVATGFRPTKWQLVYLYVCVIVASFLAYIGENISEATEEDIIEKTLANSDTEDENLINVAGKVTGALLDGVFNALTTLTIGYMTKYYLEHGSSSFNSIEGMRAIRRKVRKDAFSKLCDNIIVDNTIDLFTNLIEKVWNSCANGKVKEVIKTTVDKIMNSILSAFGMRFPLLEEKVKVRINDESGNVK